MTHIIHHFNFINFKENITLQVYIYKYKVITTIDDKIINIINAFLDKYVTYNSKYYIRKSESLTPIEQFLLMIKNIKIYEYIYDINSDIIKNIDETNENITILNDFSKMVDDIIHINKL